MERDARAYPQRPIVGVAAVIFVGDKALLVRRAKDPGRGSWSLPGGAVELGETALAAVCREVREELAIEIEVGGVAGVFDKIFTDSEGRIKYHYVLIDFWAELGSGSPTAGSDIDAVRCLTPDECEKSDLDSMLRAVVARAALLRAARPGVGCLVDGVQESLPVGP